MSSTKNINLNRFDVLTLGGDYTFDIFNGLLLSSESMYFSHNCRKNNIFMYVDNIEKYGFIYEGIKDIVPQNAQNLSLYFLP